MIDFNITSEQPFDIITALQMTAQQNIAAKTNAAQQENIENPTIESIRGVPNEADA